MAKHIVFTIHGIRTYGQWQEQLEELVTKAEKPRKGELKFVNYKIGYFSLIAFVLPPIRWLVVRMFRRTLLRETRALRSRGTSG